MPRVVPSQVVRFIDSIPLPIANEFVYLHKVDPGSLSSVLDLYNQIPSELLTMDGDSYAILTLAKAKINDMVAIWTSNRNAGHALQSYTFKLSDSPLAHIRDALATCPDESPAPGTSELSFISEMSFRVALRNDIGAINRALANGEWKAATVLAGSAVEALLLWALDQHQWEEIKKAIDKLKVTGTLEKHPDRNLEKWNLHEFIEVAASLKVINSDTADQVRLTKNFRNLIHPGRARRLPQTSSTELQLCLP